MAIVSETIKLLGAAEKEVVKDQYYYGLVQKNVLVTGANGQLGSELKLIANKINMPFRFFFTDADVLDITSEKDLNEFVVNNNIKYIINCAAYTAVVKAESESSKAFDVNVRGVENIALVAKQNGVNVIHVSTDFVFDGTSDTAYSEDMKTNPLSVYGFTKLKGEEALKLIWTDWII